MRTSAKGQAQADQQDHPEVAPKSTPVKTSRFSRRKKAPLPHPTRHERFTVATVEAALRKHRGMIARAARMLRCTPQTIRNYMQRHPTLAQVVADERALIVDAAELKLHAAVQRGEPWAICFTLKCLGKDRGYIEREARTGADGQPPHAADQNNVIIVGGSKAEYLEGLRWMREAARATMQRATNDVRPVAQSVHSNADNGKGSA